jgi:arsenate reductase
VKTISTTFAEPATFEDDFQVSFGSTLMKNMIRDVAASTEERIKPGMNKIRVLFICTGNSCRSQMAEGWTRHLWSDRIEAYSAGILPSGVNRFAIAVMKEAGVNISVQRSKHVDTLKHLPFDAVITLCDEARASCPVFPGKVRILHHGFPDPVLAMGTNEEILNAFRRVRDEIRAFIENLPRIPATP